jgi:hypothetical protein
MLRQMRLAVQVNIKVNTGFCKYWKQMRNSKSSEVMMHHSVGGISIAGTVYALLTVYVKVQDSQTS